MRVSTESGLWPFESSKEQPILVKDLLPPFENSLPAFLTTKIFNMKKIFSGLLSLVVLFSTVIIIQACNSEPKKNDAVTTNVETTNQAVQAEAPATSFTGNFPYLTLSRTDLTAFFTPSNIQKVVFRFQFDDGNALPSLVAFQATSIRVYNPNPLTPRLTKEILTKSFSGEMFLGNLEMSRTQYTSLMTASGTATKFIFEPKLKGNNVIYGITWSDSFNKDSVSAMTFPPAYDLNPSPPDPPGGSN